jgi:hydroxymethylpyrimidine/phosphomethylpyrimidine kinase
MTAAMEGRVLVVAGSDSGGGAGIQADIKTITALGGYAATAITALTAQNTLGVFGVFPVDPDFVAQQMDLVLSDIGADAIKTGMLYSADTIEVVVRVLEKRAGTVPLIVDPVMIAKGGAELLDSSALFALRRRLIPRAALVTPNAPEAAAIANRPVETLEDMGAAADYILALGASAVLVKGAHIPGDEIVDLLRTADGDQILFRQNRIDSTSTHGTGCTLASAIAAGVAEGLTLRDSVSRAEDYVHKAILAAPGFGGGHGPLDHAFALRCHPCNDKELH